MSKTRLRLITIATLAGLMILSLCLAIAALPFARNFAGAVTYSPDSIFSAGSDGGVEASSAEGEGPAYLRLTFADNASGKAENFYRRNLALKWFEAAEAPADPSSEEVLRANPGKAVYFSMTFAFEDLSFSSFEMLFTSAEESVTKEGTSTNALYFTYDGALNVRVLDSSFDREEDKESDVAVGAEIAYTAGTDLTLTFGEGEQAGEFSVALHVGEAVYALAPFTNIGGNYIEYRSASATTPQTPITFTAKFAQSDTTDKKASVLVKSLNGQSLELKDGKVEDTAYPVLVLDKEIYGFRLGRRFSLSYTVVDVCDDTPSTPTRQYYMLKTEEVDGKTIWHKPTDSDYKSINNNNFLMPTSEDEEVAFVSLRFGLRDDTHTTDQKVYLTWYAADVTREDEPVVEKKGDADYTAATSYRCNVCGTEITVSDYETAQSAESYTCKGKLADGTACTGTLESYEAVTGNYFDYIRVDLSSEGPAYLHINALAEDKINERTADAEEAFNGYQQLVDAAAEKVSAGDGAYFYLPTLRNLIASKYADYRDLSFSIFYYKPGTTAGGSASSATSLSYNALRIEVDEWGEYRFRVTAQEKSSGNAMKYYDEDGNLVSLTSSNVWDIEEIPEFTFYIDYDGPSIEEAGEQDRGYRDRSYTVTRFDIIALDGYESEYELYRLDTEAIPENEQRTFEYKDLVNDLETWTARFEEWDVLRKINVYNADVAGDDDELERNPDNAYHWDPDSSLSFTPQASGYYFVKVTVKDAYLAGTTESAYQVISIGNPTDVIEGRSPWLENNRVSIILFSIAGVLLVALLVIAVAFPSEKKVEEVDLEKLKGKKQRK